MGRLVGARALAFAGALLMLISGLPGLVAEHDEAHAGTLPAPLVGAEAVEWRDGAIYLFGGRITRDEFSNAILRYDPANGTTTQVTEFPPPSASAPGEERQPGRYQGAAVAVGDHIYYLGGAVLTHQAGFGGGSVLVPESIPDIVQFDPANGTARRVATELPHGVWGLAAAAHEGSVYAFGGLTFDTGPSTHFERHDRVIRFDPHPHNGGHVTLLDATLPFPVQDAAAVTNGVIRLVGGLGSQSGWDHVCPGGANVCPTNAVVTFDPVTESVRGVTARLPERLTFADAVQAGDRLVVVGGRAVDGSDSPHLLALDATHAGRLHATLPSGVSGTAAVLHEGALLTFGGTSGGNETQDVWRTTGLDGAWDVAPEAPVDLATAPAENGVRLAWSADASDAYRVYRRANGTDVVTHVATVHEPAFTDRSAEPNTVYEYRVTSVRDGLESAYSRSVHGAWQALTPPVDLVAETVGTYVPGVERSIQLRWSPPEHEGPHAVTGYRVYRSVDGGAWAWLADTPDVTSFTDGDAPTLDDVAYRVTALTAVEESAPSDTAVVTVAASVLRVP